MRSPSGTSRVRPINLVLIGAPGSGKGTQAVHISSRYKVPAISTGDILRAAVKAKSPLGLQVQATMEAGDLVSDGMMIDLVRERLAQPDAATGFILDGFPRTIAQAHAFDAMMGPHPIVAVVLTVPEPELERRLGSRRICSSCKTLHTGGTSYGSEAELCSRCGALLLRRADDNEETIRNRLRTYRETTEPLIEHYRGHAVLEIVDGFQPPETVRDALFACLDERG